MGSLLFFGSGGFGLCIYRPRLVVAGDHLRVVGVTFRKPRHDILDVVSEVKAVQFADLQQGVHERYVARAVVAPAMEPVAPAHGYVAEHAIRCIVVHHDTPVRQENTKGLFIIQNISRRALDQRAVAGVAPDRLQPPLIVHALVQAVSPEAAPCAPSTCSPTSPCRSTLCLSPFSLAVLILPQRYRIMS